MDKVILRHSRDYNVIHRHPWIFSGAVDKVVGEPANGSVVEVVNNRGVTLGYGNYSPASQIRVRMISFGSEAASDGDYVAELVRLAVSRRERMMTSSDHCGVRLVHGEADGLPGVIADFYGGWAVTQFATAGAEFWKDVIVKALMDYVPGIKGVYNRSDVDGRKHEALALEGDAVKGLLAGEEPPEFIEIHEGAIKYLVDVRRGHKTGFYLDQRDARAQVGEFSSGCEVLNAFSYTGGFGLAAMANGAKYVTNVDLSAEALAMAKRNFELTFGSNVKNVDFVCADVFQQLRKYRDQGRSFDLIVLDPPKFADTKGQLIRAARGYKDINLLAMKLLRAGGTLATFSCSGAMSSEFFDKVIAEAAFDAGCDFQIVARTRQAADHPESLFFPEGFYLKGVILRKIK